MVLEERNLLRIGSVLVSPKICSGDTFLLLLTMVGFIRVDYLKHYYKFFFISLLLRLHRLCANCSHPMHTWHSIHTGYLVVQKVV